MIHQPETLLSCIVLTAKVTQYTRANFFKAKLICIIMDLIKPLSASPHWTQRNLNPVKVVKETDTRNCDLGPRGACQVYLWTANLIPHLPSSNHRSTVTMLPELHALSVNTWCLCSS